MSKSFTDIDGEALEALIARVTEAKENHLALSSEDCQLLLDALTTLIDMQDNLSSHGVTIHKLRKLLGIEKSSEKHSDLVDESKPKKKTRSRKSKADVDFAEVKPTVVFHNLDHLKKGDTCPECLRGKVYKVEPGNFLRITGQSPFTPEQHVMEKLRCNTCGAYFTAPLPEDVLKDGTETQKYGYSARSLMAIYKYFAGLPFYRQGSIGKLLGVKITASTTYDQVNYVSNDIDPVYRYLLGLAGDAEHYYLDDTSHRIIDQKPIEKPCRNNSNKTRVRTGVYTSGVVATITVKAETQSIVLFETNIGHAGEFIDSILTNRDESTATPIIMCDALPSNKPSVKESIISLCNSHARRQFVDVINNFPDEVEHVLASYGKIWTNDHKTIDSALTATERLDYHAKHSLPIMEEIKQWGETHLSNETIEANSGLGKAITYFNKHYAGLSRFCTLEGCKLDNNRIEAMLKIIVRDRKNAMFRKTLEGASTGDVLTSMIATASEAGANVFEYLTHLQQHKDEVKCTPEKFLPWNYLENSK